MTGWIPSLVRESGLSELIKIAIINGNRDDLKAFGVRVKIILRLRGE